MKNAEERIKLVVYKEHTLGYIDPKLPNNVNILHTSPLKGSPRITSDDSFCINNENEVRLAGKKDFDDFRVSFNGYDNKDLYVFLSEENIDIIFLSAISKAGSEGINACFYMDRVALDSILIRYDLEGIENKMGELATICRSGSDDEIYKANKEYEILEDKLKIKAANALEQLNIKTSFKDLQHLSGTTNENEIIGKISYYGFDGNVSEVMEYTDKESYLNAIRKEMRENPDGLKHQTLTSDPELRKVVDDIMYGAYGVDNPHTLDWYSPSKDVFLIYEDKSEGISLEIELTQQQQSELKEIETKLEDLKKSGVEHLSLFSFDYTVNLYTDASFEKETELREFPEVSNGVMRKEIEAKIDNDQTNCLNTTEYGTMYTTEAINSVIKRIQDKSIFVDKEVSTKPVLTTDEIPNLNKGLNHLLESVKNEVLNSHRISDIHIYSLKTGSIAINCKIDGVPQHAVKMSREDVNSFGEKTDRYSLVSKYFSDTLKKDPSQVQKEGVRNIKKFTSPKINNNKPKHKM
ncbi:hypothetical protein [Massilibacteroides vaginae]|uniref:hypothetical protein n=1 Tax=Massilibacteroides vaginae TaxID=1673718 RepID=UPI00159310EC|nr:hypothetical protein [Massilibacteroides vaginae]